MKRLPGVCLVLVLVLGLAACGAAQPPVPVPVPPSVAAGEGAQLLVLIRAEIGDAACSADAQCRTLPIGARACGGPAAWWAWSTASADGAKLQTLAARLHAVEQERLLREGLLSTCIALPDSGAACVAGRCAVNRPGAAR
ncbi:MAG: hypothetical protein IT500_07030 [Rubrivivax sp.]|nr:hypothetical protein [Rubrivivax sp.]